MYDEQKKEKLLDGEQEVRYDTVSVDFLSYRDVQILTQIGVPESVSPFINMESKEQYGGYSLFDRINIFEKCEKEDSFLKELCLIGSVDYGYLVIQKDGEIGIWGYESESLSYVNGSLDAFLDCAYKYYQFIIEIQEKYGEDAYMDASYEEGDVELLKSHIAEIDPNAIDNGFWAEQIECLYEEIGVE